MGQATLPHSDGGAALRSHLSVEGKIPQNISLEDIMVRFGDRGKVKTAYCRVIHYLLFGTPKLSWRNIVMIITWDTRESYARRMIPCVRLISAMILQQNQLQMEALWVSKPVDQICFASIKQHWKITVQVFGHQYTVSDDQGYIFQYTDPSATQEAAREEEMIDKENEDEPPDLRGPRQRYARPHQEISSGVANFVINRRKPVHCNYNQGQHDVYDNVSAGIGETQEYEERRRQWEHDWQAQQQAQWAEEAAHRAKEQEY
ncbi:hypothetical protein HanIR_Chr05g0244231 [Helianthus annuus]|nr:hypothetical protein HanIR_Chr05g0244231 [Helianthus annuus]